MHKADRRVQFHGRTMKSITEIISDLSIDVACLLDEPEDVTKEDLIKMQDSITELENRHISKYDNKTKPTNRAGIHRGR